MYGPISCHFLLADKGMPPKTEGVSGNLGKHRLFGAAPTFETKIHLKSIAQ
jgi:hypothetical protein